MRWNALSVVGPWGDGFLRRINVSRAFLGAAGLTMQAGLTDATEEEAQIKRAMVSPPPTRRRQWSTVQRVGGAGRRFFASASTGSLGIDGMPGASRPGRGRGSRGGYSSVQAVEAALPSAAGDHNIGTARRVVVDGQPMSRMRPSGRPRCSAPAHQRPNSLANEAIRADDENATAAPGRAEIPRAWRRRRTAPAPPPAGSSGSP